jgi:hypothetical protein
MRGLSTLLLLQLACLRPLAFEVSTPVLTLLLLLLPLLLLLLHTYRAVSMRLELCVT